MAVGACGKGSNTTSVSTRIIRLKTHKAVGTHGGKAQKTTSVWTGGTRIKTQRL